MRTIRRHVFETNSSSMHAITVCSPTYGDKKEVLLKRLAPFLSNDQYNIEIECNELLLKVPFDMRAYHIHDDVRSMLMYWLASVIQYYNKKIYHMKAEENENNDIYNKLICTQFKDYIDKITNELKADFEYILKKPVNLKFVYYVNEDSNSINYGDDKSDAWFSTGCYGNDCVYFALKSHYDLFDWLASEDCKLFCSSDEVDNTEMFKDIVAAKDSYVEKYKAYNDSFEQDEETYDEDCAFQEMLEKGLTNNFKVLWPTGG